MRDVFYEFCQDMIKTKIKVKTAGMNATLIAIFQIKTVQLK
jgi:hypothetical protein